jgi:hypothetical protein
MRIEWAIIVGLSASARANLRASSRLSKSPEGWARMVGGVLGPDGLSKNWIVNFIPDHIAGASYYASFSLGRLFKLRHSPRAASSASDMSLSSSVIAAAERCPGPLNPTSAQPWLPPGGHDDQPPSKISESCPPGNRLISSINAALSMKRIYRKILRELHPDELSLLRRDQECFTVGPQNSRAIAADHKLFLFGDNRS